LLLLMIALRDGTLSFQRLFFFRAAFKLVNVFDCVEAFQL
jgi:hypothetical protein